MLFNSYIFIFGFLPAVLTLVSALRPAGDRAQQALLLLASLVFYGWWDARLLPLLVSSFTVNYVIGCSIARGVAQGREPRAAWLMTLGIGANLLVLAYFKYGHFIEDNVGWALGVRSPLGAIILPLGISFFTFEQISFLVDARRGQARPGGFLVYALFVSFFPRLVAGPILRYNEIGPQLTRWRRADGRIAANLALGLTLFSIGLLKKAVFADGIAPYATPVFAAAARGEHIDLLTAWGGALAYTCQLYFDFSGYSDMAIGVARCFGIRFPVNFDSPYKATSIIEFWRRWHMTLSRFLRDYLYFALGGNRRGPARRYANLLLTMLLGGLWHGASWTFVFWGGLHGAYLMINHGWLAVVRLHPSLKPFAGSRVGTVCAWCLTFFAVVVAWVFFRSPSFAGALRMLSGMAGCNGVALPAGLAFLLGPEQPLLTRLGISFSGGSGMQLVKTYLWVSALMGIVLLFPSSQQFLARAEPVLDVEGGSPEYDTSRGAIRLQWSPSPPWAMAIATVSFVAIISITRVSEFLYWQF